MDNPHLPSRRGLPPLTEANHDILIRYSEANPLITQNGRLKRDTETLPPQWGDSSGLSGYARQCLYLAMAM